MRGFEALRDRLGARDGEDLVAGEAGTEAGRQRVLDAVGGGEAVAQPLGGVGSPGFRT